MYFEGTHLYFGNIIAFSSGRGCILTGTENSERKRQECIQEFIRKVFRPLNFLHVVTWQLYKKKWLNCSPLSIYTQYNNNDKAKTGFEMFANVLKIYLHPDPSLSTLLNHLWQQLQPPAILGMTPQAWHTCICGVSHLLLCRSSQTLAGWLGSVAAQLFSGLSRDDWWGSSPGSGWATQGYWDLSRSHSCIDLAVCLGSLSCWKVNLRPILRSWAGFHQGSLYFAPFIFPSILTSLPFPATEKHAHNMMLPPPCFTVGMVAGFLQMWRLAFRPKSSNLNLVSHGQSFRCLLANSKWAVMCLLLKSGFRLATLP